MDFKKMLVVLTITISIIFTLLWGTSYAYYVSSGGTNLNVTTGDFDAGVAVVFTQSEYIDTLTGIPIAESDVATNASKTVFKLTPDSTILNGYDVAVNVSLVDFSMASELRVDDFKYDLVCNDGASDRTIGSGTGAGITDEMLANKMIPLGTLTTSNNTFDINKNYSCSFRIWLQESGSDQNSLMNKNLTGRIHINSAFKK